jgi:hypothetical protein
MVAIIALSLTLGLAKEKPEWRSWPMGDRMIGSVGYYKPKLDTKAAIATDGGEVGVLISFEESLGLSDSKGTGIIGFLWRISKRNAVGMNYFKLDRNSDKDTNIFFYIDTEPPQDPTLQVPISSVFNIESIDIQYTYSFIFTPKHNLAAGIGLALQNLEFGFRPSENCDLADPCGLVKPHEADATVPLPTFTLVYQYAINDKWIIDANIGYLALELELGNKEDLEGRIWNATAGVRWKTWDHVGFHAGYKYFDVDVDYQKRSVVAAADYDYRGFEVGITAFF